MCTRYPMGGKKQVSNFSVQATAAKLCVSVPHANMCCMQLGIMKDTSPTSCRRKTYCEHTCRCILSNRKQLHKRKCFKFYSSLESQNTKLTGNHPLFMKKINKEKINIDHKIKSGQWTDWVYLLLPYSVGKEHSWYTRTIPYSNLVAHVQTLYQLTRSRSSPPRCNGWLRSHRKLTNLVLCWQYTGAFTSVTG